MSCWDVIKVDFEMFINDFYIHLVLPKAVTATFIALIPKTNNPQSLDEYRPTCLIGSLYQILAKFLASRHKKVMPKLIFNTQTVFLPKRKIMDGVLVTNQFVNFAKHYKKSRMLVKVDFKKA